MVTNQYCLIFPYICYFFLMNKTFTFSKVFVWMDEKMQQKVTKHLLDFCSLSCPVSDKIWVAQILFCRILLPKGYPPLTEFFLLKNLAQLGGALPEGPPLCPKEFSPARAKNGVFALNTVTNSPKWDKNGPKNRK